MLAFGFLSVIEHELHGLTGGLLVLNENARPLEFHCTSPLKPNRAQQILYGPTLEPYLYGEQIGQTLIHKAAQLPDLVLTDTAACLATRDFVKSPVAWIRMSQSELSDTVLHWTHYALQFSGNHQTDHSTSEKLLASLPRQWDLLEPFARIRNALDEAQRLPRAA
jgi:hypothetical protein